ncbi:MAG: cysteine-rich CWC family protein [Flavobacteriales bacterium]|nr:cysteine-rich CWC family protein [Flavobacteriales bacterium]
MPVTTCARCTAPITCTPQDIAQCACGKVPLSPADHVRIAARYTGCLCNACLMELRDDPIDRSSSEDEATRDAARVEGADE